MPSEDVTLRLRHNFYWLILDSDAQSSRTNEPPECASSHPTCFPSSSSLSQRRGAPAGGEWRQRKAEQWRGQGKAQAREVVEDESCEQHGKEAVPMGTCQTMCPARELQDREVQNRLHRFEMLAGTERDRRPRGDPLRAVKEYSRPAAGKDSTNPTDLRPPAVLLKTVCYLIDDIAASPRLHQWTEASSISPVSDFTVVS
ncbi:hypothetical protein FQN60_013340 [Etheostoma spectabile]|uniref:SAC3/GANP/THP3 conserved domain-containing protein n=1 Tax=Etheostoma spectabile TaxID=54343 RepID=A0A5J5DB88_9PERO|nr:hypothetical protein FQN60_013340 [Etheostoma spectabile]